MKYCYKCFTPWENTTQPQAKETCLKCGQDLHICLNCKFYDTYKSNQCLVNDLDPVIYKDRFNFCEEFQFADRQPVQDTKNNKPSEADAARQKWNQLFKK